MPTEFAGLGRDRSSTFENPYARVRDQHDLPGRSASSHNSDESLMGGRWSDALGQWRDALLDLGCAHSAELRAVTAHQMVWRIDAAQLVSHWRRVVGLTAESAQAVKLEAEHEAVEDTYDLADFHASVPRRSMGKWKAKVKVTGRHIPQMVLSDDQLRVLAELADADE